MAKFFERKEPEAPLQPTAPETHSVPEQPVIQAEASPAAIEQQPNADTQPVESKPVGVRAGQTQQPVAPAPAAPVVKSPLRKDIEAMLADGLTEVYQGMTPEQQQTFRKKGEEVASTIEILISTFHAKARQVVGLIREWLKLIPGVNKYFLEQESKLKTDDIMKYQRNKKAEQRNKRFL